MRRRFLSTNQRPVRYMTVEPLENGVYLSFGGQGLYYSIDDSEWVSLPNDTNTPSINIGQTIKIKGLNIKTDTRNNHFIINGRCKLSGTIMSIIYGDKPYEEKIPLNIDFTGAFCNCTSIVSVAPDFLPATTLADGCYQDMFYGCTSLTVAPELPATTLADGCYKFMFYGCTSLTTAPELPATTLASNCYRYMFQNCTSLTTAPELPVTTLANYCYYGMFNGCTSLTTAPELPATTLTNSCYYNMFSGCTSLTTAPELPATTLASNCYSLMFLNCSKLNYIKMLATDVSAYNCLHSWVDNISSTGTFVKNPAMTSLPTATSSNYYAGIPSGWSVQNA